MSRFSRKNRTASDLGLKGCGGLTDAFDDVMKDTYRINDSEYDFICENCTDEELSIILNDQKVFSKMKQSLIVIENALAKMHP